MKSRDQKIVVLLFLLLIFNSVSTLGIEEPIGAKACDQEIKTIVGGSSPKLDQLKPIWDPILQNSGFAGKTWFGKLASNQKQYPSGSSATETRITMVFVPCTTDLTKPIEMMYYFHGIRGFAEWDLKERIAPQVKKMGESGRNFVLVFPQLPWALFDLKGNSHTGAYVNAIGDGEIWLAGDSNLVQLHDDAKRIVSELTGTSPNVQYISLLGHSGGGGALGFAGTRPSPENNPLLTLRPNKIVFSDADYGWKDAKNPSPSLQGSASAYKRVYDNYLRQNPNAQLYILVQDPSRQGAHEPTQYAIDFMKYVGGSATASWSREGGKWTIAKTESYTTPGAQAGKIFTSASAPNVHYVPLNIDHLSMGKMSLSWLPTELPSPIPSTSPPPPPQSPTPLPLTPASSSSCSQDLYIPLAYPNEYQERLRTPQDPINAGLVWIPKEACGKKVDLLIIYHGWRSLANPGDSIFLTPPANTFYDGYPGQQSQQKEIDKLVRSYIDSGKSAPLVIAAPMHDRGNQKTVFTEDAYDINTHIALIKQKLAEKGIAVEFNRVSLLGHSNANCGGGSARAAKEVTGYPLYFYGAADGTCGDSNFLSKYDLIQTIKEKAAVLFHMHQNGIDGESVNTLKSFGGEQDNFASPHVDQYNDRWKSTDGKFFTYGLTPGADHGHGAVPGLLLREALPRFFPSSPIPPAAQPSSGVQPGVTQGSSASAVGGSTALRVSQNCLVDQRCREIDEVWKILAPPLNKPELVWVPGKGWLQLSVVYPPISSTSSVQQSSASPLPVPPVPAPSPAQPQFTGTGPCFQRVISSTKEEANSNLVPFSFQGKNIRVHRIIVPLLEKINTDISALNLNYDFNSVGSFNWRCVCSPLVRYADGTCYNSPTCKDTNGEIQTSRHSFGAAIDINPLQNPFCKRASDGSYRKSGNICTFDIPSQVIEIFRANDFRWGGDWQDAKDYMHFDWKGNRGDFNGDGVIEECPAGTASPSSQSVVTTDHDDEST